MSTETGLVPLPYPLCEQLLEGDFRAIDTLFEPDRLTDVQQRIHDAVAPGHIPDNNQAESEVDTSDTSEIDSLIADIIDPRRRRI